MPSLFRFARSAFLASIAIAALAASPRLAHAQVNDSDRAAARELFVEGVKLQEQGKLADALDKFQRAQAVFSAPTHLLHIAECQAALGKLVESAETYRTLVRTPLPPSSPPAFVQAQQQGAAELTQVEPRIPTLKVLVKPEGLPNVSILIDGQPMSAALIGFPRPSDPGEHTVIVFAPSYTKSEQKITLHEREQKELAVTLQVSASGVTYAPASGTGTLTPLPPDAPPPGVTYVNPGATTTPPTRPQAQAGQPGQGGLASDTAPPAYQSGLIDANKKHGSSTSFFLGAHAGGEFPGGSLGDQVSGGGSFGLDAGLRFARVFYIGALYEHGIYSDGSRVGDITAPAGAAVAPSTSNTSNYFGGNIAWITNPDGLAFYLELGYGYRWMDLSRKFADPADSSNYATFEEVGKGSEGSIAFGIHFKIGDAVRIIPKLTIAGGTFDQVDKSCDSGGAARLACGSAPSLIQTTSHSMTFLGIAGFYDLGKHGP